MHRLLFAVGLLTAFAGLAVVTASPASATGGSIVAFHDGFEQPAVSSWVTYSAGSQMGVWAVTRGNVHLAGANTWEMDEGNQSLDLDGFQNGGVAVTISTIPWAKYKVRYALAGNPADGPAVKSGKALINGAVVHSFSFDITGRTLADMGYVDKSFWFIASGHETKLEFVSTTNPSSFGPVLDDVVVKKCLLVLC